MSRTTAPFALALSFFLGLTACGGDDDDDGGGDDDPVQLDASEVEDIDAAPPYTGLGQACEVEDEASCPTDFACIQTEGGSGPWCTTECTMEGMLDPACDAAYEGPGLAGCFLSIMMQGGGGGGGDGQLACGVLCMAPSQACPANICDGTCPGDLVCGEPDGNGYALCQ